jgi:hypothetical protein
LLSDGDVAWCNRCNPAVPGFEGETQWQLIHDHLAKVIALATS